MACLQALMVVTMLKVAVLVFMDCAESKARVCFFGQPPELDAADMHQWTAQFMELVWKGCPRQCSASGASNDDHFAKEDSCQRLGLEDGTIPDERIRASSDGDFNPAAMGRLNGPSNWSPTYCLRPTSCWIGVDLLQTTRVSGVITQGNKLVWASHLVTEFQVSYKPTPSSSYEYIKETNGDIKLFDGGDVNSASTPHTNYFNQSLMASTVRIHPTVYIGKPVLRFELIQCPMD
ncbi:inactive carboxypeptidase-like protein X2 [Patiria miniata]|uniref:F5/8 type C domain-containing protein n=1 Tax=Patiria miniata TaxID=46514 RepID=A0A914ATF3_PATMI|nr:inactive carboxypeptidase-like protein X2 [Patiria miniata]